MAATTSTGRTSAPAGRTDPRSASGGVQVPTGGLKTRQHRPGYIALLVALVVGLALAGGWLYTSAGATSTVLVVASDIDAGQVIERSDVTTISLSGEVGAITADDVSSVVGKRARVTLLRGTLLQRPMIGAGALLPAGQVLVGALLPAGAAPAGGLVAGDLVDVYRLPAAAAAGRDAEPAPTVVAKRVPVHAVAVSKELSSAGLLVTLMVPSEVAAAVVAANGAGVVAVAVVGP